MTRTKDLNVEMQRRACGAHHGIRDRQRFFIYVNEGVIVVASVIGSLKHVERWRWCSIRVCQVTSGRHTTTGTLHAFKYGTENWKREQVALLHRRLVREGGQGFVRNRIHHERRWCSWIGRSQRAGGQALGFRYAVPSLPENFWCWSQC